MKVRGLSALALGLLVGASVLIGAPGALAAPSPTCLAYAPAGTSSVPTVSDATPSPGQTITVTSGDCQFTPGSDVPNSFGSTPLNGVTASPAGGATVTYTLPCDTAAGDTSFTFDGTLDGVANTVSVPLTVGGGSLCGTGGGAAEGPAAAPAAPAAPATPIAGGDSGPALPFTGSDVLIPGAIAGLTLLLVGGILVAGSRRRRHTA